MAFQILSVGSGQMLFNLDILLFPVEFLSAYWPLKVFTKTISESPAIGQGRKALSLLSSMEFTLGTQEGIVMSGNHHPLQNLIRLYNEILSRLEVPEPLSGDFSRAINDVKLHVLNLEGKRGGREEARSEVVNGGQDEPTLQIACCDEILVRAFFSKLPMGAVLIDKNRKIIQTNQAFLDLFEYRTQEVLSKKIDDIVAQTNLTKRIAARTNLFKKPGEEHLTTVTKREKKDGTIVEVLFTYFPVHIKGESFAYCVYHDVTEIFRTQKALRRAKRELEESLESTLRAFSKLIEGRDAYTAEHQRRVAFLAKFVARVLGLQYSDTKNLYSAALLHDIGKISIPSEILAKPGKLNEIEMKMIQNHPKTGYEIVRTMKFPPPVAECVLHHHERLDGSGYPLGLHGDEIDFLAQILAVLDVFEAMTSHRPYRPDLGFDAAIEELRRGSGTKYNPQAIQALEKLIRSQKLEEFKERAKGPISFSI